MALPDSNNEVTARKLGATISAMWTKIKSTFAPISHTHGNITNAGALQTTDVSVSNGDKLVVTDASNSNKVARASVTFDGSTTTTALTPKGTFETFLQSHQDISGKEDTSNKVTSWQSTPDDTHYPSEKLVKDTIDANGKGFVEVTTSNTYADITAILDEGKIPYIKMSAPDTGYPPTLYLIFAGKSSNPGGAYYYFNSTVYGTSQYVVSVNSSSTWGTITKTSLQDTSLRVSAWSSTVSNSRYPSEKLVKDTIDGIKGLVKVTTSNTYDDVTAILDAGKIPYITWGTGGQGYSTTVYLICASKVRNGASLYYTFTASVGGIVYQYKLTKPNTWEISYPNFQNIDYRVSSWQSTPDNSHYPSEKLVKDSLDGKQDALTAQTAYSAKGSGTKVPQITTNSLGQVTGITEVNIEKVYDVVYNSTTYAQIEAAISDGYVLRCKFNDRTGAYYYGEYLGFSGGYYYFVRRINFDNSNATVYRITDDDQWTLFGELNPSITYMTTDQETAIVTELGDL